MTNIATYRIPLLYILGYQVFSVFDSGQRQMGRQDLRHWDDPCVGLGEE